MTDTDEQHPRRFSLKRIPRLTLKIAIIFFIYPYLLACVMLALFQRSLLYFPNVIRLEELEDKAAHTGLKLWTGAKGNPIGWFYGDSAASPDLIFLVLHGNSGMAATRVHYAQTIARLLPGKIVHTYILEYPGYGPRSGTPSQESFVSAATEAYRQVSRQQDCPLYLIGESLGAAVACQLAAHEPSGVQGVLLITPFNNLVDVASHHYPFFPIRWLVKDTYASDQALLQYNGPLAIVIGDRDRVVPPEFGLRLYESYAGPKKHWVIDDSGHNLDRTSSTAWWKEVLAFWNLKS